MYIISVPNEPQGWSLSGDNDAKHAASLKPRMVVLTRGDLDAADEVEIYRTLDTVEKL